MKTILFLDHTAKIGGGEIALLNLVTALNKTRFLPVVVLASDGPLVQKLRAVGVETHVLPLDSAVIEARKDTLGAASLLRLGQAAALARYAIRLARWARARRVDLIHTNSLKSDFYGGVAGRLARLPVLWHVRDHVAAPYLPRLIAQVFCSLSRVLPRAVVAISESTKHCLEPVCLRRSQGAQAERLFVVHDGCDPSLYAAESKDQTPRDEAAPIVALVGRIAEWKGQHVFLNAIAQVCLHFPAARFWIVGAPLFGEEDYEQTLRAQARALNIEAVVEFLGFRDDVPSLLRQVDIVVHASTLGEPFGQVVIEGMAAGKPVVATQGGALPEIVVPGETGLLVPMGDAEALAQAVRRLLANPSQARSLGQAGQERVNAHFTVRQTAAKIEAIYEQILG